MQPLKMTNEVCRTAVGQIVSYFFHCGTLTQLLQAPRKPQLIEPLLRCLASRSREVPFNLPQRKPGHRREKAGFICSPMSHTFPRNCDQMALHREWIKQIPSG